MEKLYRLATLLLVSTICVQVYSQNEIFYFRYRGGEGWEGNSPAQPTASKITAARVGEYYWMQKNFNAWDPFTPTAYYYNYVAFSEQTMTDYFKTIQATDPSAWKNLYNVTVDDINENYGYYYEPWGAFRLHLWGIFSSDAEGNEQQHPNGAGTYQQQYRLPYHEDVRQLFAMSPFVDPLSPSHYTLNERDIRYTIGANKQSNNCAVNFVEDATTQCYWFNAYDTYGLGYMPAGWRSQVWNDWFYNDIWNPETSDGRWNVGMGGLAQMFFALYIPIGSKTYLGLQDDIVTLAEHVNSVPNPKYRDISPKRTPLRWMRPLTDEELGYKLYIRIPEIEKSDEWKALRDNKDEIPLLKAIRHNIFKINDISIDIRKIPHADSSPSDYVELPKGYLRGFYVQYNIDKELKLSGNELAKYAANVEDEVLGFDPNVPVGLEEIASIPTKSSVKLYPNPTSVVLNINSVTPVKSVKIIDSFGRICLYCKNKDFNSLDISELKNGVYIVNIESEDRMDSYKIIKK